MNKKGLVDIVTPMLIVIFIFVLLITLAYAAQYYNEKEFCKNKTEGNHMMSCEDQRIKIGVCNINTTVIVQCRG